MTRLRRTNLPVCIAALLVFAALCNLAMPAYGFEYFSYASDRTTKAVSTTAAAEGNGEAAPPSPAAEASSSAELSQLQEKYDKLEKKIQEGEQGLSSIESGKQTQTQNITAIQNNINDLNEQINVLEQRVNVLDNDIGQLNTSIDSLNGDISKLNVDIVAMEDQIYDTTQTTDILYAKIKGRLVLNYMSGSASNLEVLLGVRDLPSFLTKLQIIHNLSRYDRKLLDEFEENLQTLQSLNAVLTADRKALDTKETALSGEKSTLAARQADIESSQYVLDLKKELSQHKYEEAVAYFKSLDETSSDYNAMLNMLSKEQDKVDNQINSYLLKYGSSADRPSATSGEGVTNASGDGESVSGGSAATAPAVSTTRSRMTNPYEKTTASTTTTMLDDIDSITFPGATSVAPVSPESMNLIWPLPYKNCYISAYYGQYPSGGEHHGVDMCVRGGTEGKNVVAAASGRVISYGFNHWSMGNYVIIDHGNGLFTAYYHMQRLYVAQGDSVSQGQVIGLAGHTGNTTGPHLHFEVRVSRGGVITRMNPLKFVSLPG